MCYILVDDEHTSTWNNWTNHLFGLFDGAAYSEKVKERVTIIKFDLDVSIRQLSLIIKHVVACSLYSIKMLTSLN